MHIKLVLESTQAESRKNPKIEDLNNLEQELDSLNAKDKWSNKRGAPTIIVIR